MEQKVLQNIRALEFTKQVLQSLIKERNTKRSSEYYEAFEMISVLRILQRRIDSESRTLAALRFQPPPPASTPPDYPPLPEEVRRNPKSIQDSDFFQTIWSHLKEK